MRAEGRDYVRLSVSHPHIVRAWFCLFILLFIGSLVFFNYSYFFDITRKPPRSSLPVKRTWVYEMEQEEQLEEQQTQQSPSLSLQTQSNEQQDASSHRKYDTHIFYYIWYRNPKQDGKYEHWNHSVLPHWLESVNQQHPIGKRFDAERDDIGANFYPYRGLYSSTSKETMLEQFRELKEKANVHVLAVSWWGVSGSDSQKTIVNHLIPDIMDAAQQIGVKIIFHLEPYEGRSAKSTRDDIKYLLDKYFNHPALYKTFYKGKWKPFFYVYDSYLIPANEWAEMLTDNSWRGAGSHYDSIIVGLWVQYQDAKFFKEAHFDGFYTYFAATGFTYASTLSNWNYLAQFAKDNQMLFIPSVGPGYIDTRIRPWNSQNVRPRDNGNYYDQMFQEALKHSPRYLSITSYNEWHEGTNIEPAAHQKTNALKEFTYESFGPNPFFYLEKTAHWVNKLRTQEKDS